MKRGGILKRMPPRFFDNTERSSKFVRKYRTMKKYIFSLLLMLGCLSLQAQTRNKQYEDYIKKYRELAVAEMKKYHIPASITLAQGLLESGAGQSVLARKSNNHFGIKCGGDWTGKTVSHDDDARGECFRAYKHPKDSYEDHSRFLAGRSRYASLFQLSITDYKGWARGLKKAGYATNPRYADQLIGIIELYGLHVYDTKEGQKWMKENIRPHQPYIANGLVYIVVRSGDSWKAISKEFDISQKKLIKYNDLYKGYALQVGDILYLEKKNKKADKEHIVHVFRAGESMHSISQKYGIRLKNLYKLNKMDADSPSPEVGTILRLR